MLPIINPTYNRLHNGIFLVLLLLLGQGVCKAQCTLACTQNVQISLDQMGLAAVTVDFITPYAAANCPNDLELTVFDAQNVPISNVLDCSRIGQTLAVRVRHTPSNNLCYGNITVRDYLPPTLDCPEVLIACSADTSAAAVGYPIVTDNCTIFQHSDLVTFDNYTDLPCFSMHNGQTVTAKIERTWQATDASGNYNSCVQEIYIKRNTLSDVVFPQNRDGFALPFLVCGDSPNDLNLTGQPTIDGNPVYSNGDCELAIVHNDSPIMICGTAGKRILRSWTASDYCANTFTIHTQVIEVKDTTAPSIILPTNITVGTSQINCKATVTLPTPILSDNCSAVTSSVTWPFGNGLGPHTNVPVGTYTAVYTATDACNNKTTKTLQVQVLDNQAPAAICKGSIQISLPSNGQSEIPATSIDNGSFDNCGSILREISRDSTHFFSSIPISCADIGQNFKAYLRIEDSAGLHNFCTSTIFVHETTAPYLSCPSNITLDCKADYMDLAVTGQALASDNCGLDTLFFQDINAVNSCQIGDINRVWKTVDISGNSSTCQQHIKIESINTLQVFFPRDTTLSTCVDTSYLSPNLSGWPSTTGENCGVISMDYVDVVVSSPVGCFAIERTWKVRDVCTYDQNTGVGLWSKIQRIIIFDNTAPELWVPAHMTVAALDCAASVQIPSALAADCAPFSIQNTSPFADSSFANASGIYPIGSHSIWFTATDICGNSAQQNLVLTIVDSTAPQLVCRQNAVINLGQTGKKILSGLDLLENVSDNCTVPSALHLTLSLDTVDCSLLGVQSVLVSVEDAAQNTNSCTATITIVDDSNACQTGDYFELEGSVTTIGNVGIKGIPIDLVSDGYSTSDDCNSIGYFQFLDVPGGVAYRIEATNDRKPTLGVNTYDLLLIMKHMLGLQPIEEPLTLMAADANNSKSITPSDIIFLRKLILGIEQGFPSGQTWTFVPKNFVFQHPDNPFMDNPPNFINLNVLTNTNSLDFWGVKTGDVDNSVNPALARSPQDTVYLALENLFLKAGEKTVLSVKLPHWFDLEGFQFALKAKNAKLNKLELGASKMHFNTQHFNENLLDKNEIRASWTGLPSLVSAKDSILFYLEIEAETDAWLSDLLFLEEENVVAEAYTKTDVLARVLLDFGKNEKQKRGIFGSLAIYPNPFSAETRLSFDMPVATEANLKIINAQGELISEKSIACTRGRNSISLNRREFSEHGFYSFYITSPETRPLMGKGILIEDY